MSINDNNRNGSAGLNTPVAESSEPSASQEPIHAHESVDGTEKAEPVTGLQRELPPRELKE